MIPEEPEILTPPEYVSTRYYGSKRKIARWIVDRIGSLTYDSVLDGLCGTCSVAYEFKRRGKVVTCNDILKSNYVTALALIVNSKERLTEEEVGSILTRQDNTNYSDFTQRTFSGIYYTDEENRWLDTVAQNIRDIEQPYKRSIALFALFQACLIKRPFNLFHRKNLYLRLNCVDRTFQNHKTWEKDFDAYFRRFVMEANACIFSNGHDHTARNLDILDLKETSFDLVYLDPPYISPNGGYNDYYHYYHFLEGLCDYDNWREEIDYDTKHLRLKGKRSTWTKRTVVKAFETLFEKFQDSIIVVSYRSPGFPSMSFLKDLLRQHKKRVEIHCKPRKYVLSKNSQNLEILLIGT